MSTTHAPRAFRASITHRMPQLRETSRRPAGASPTWGQRGLNAGDSHIALVFTMVGDNDAMRAVSHRQFSIFGSESTLDEYWKRGEATQPGQVILGEVSPMYWLVEKLAKIQEANRKIFLGLIARSIIKGKPELTFVHFFLVGKDTEMSGKSTGEQSLKALQDELADALEWRRTHSGVLKD